MSELISIGAHDEPAHGMPVEVLLARHPQVRANVEGRFVGSGESPFTPRGEQECRALAEYVAAWAPDSIHTSPRERAREVAEAVAGMCGVPCTVDDDLAEIDFGAAEGLTFEEAKAAGVDIDLLNGPPESAPFRDGETWRCFAARIDAAAERIEHSGCRIAVIAHGGVVRALVAHWLGLPDAASWRFAVPNASIATLTLWDGTGTLRTFGIEPTGVAGAAGKGPAAGAR